MTLLNANTGARFADADVEEPLRVVQALHAAWQEGLGRAESTAAAEGAARHHINNAQSARLKLLFEAV